MQYYRKHWNNKTTFKTVCFVTPSATLKYCHNVVILFHFYLTITIAERPGVAFEKKNVEKTNYFYLYHPPATHECSQKFQPNRSYRLAGYTQHVYECLVLLYKLKKKNSRISMPLYL